MKTIKMEMDKEIVESILATGEQLTKTCDVLGCGKLAKYRVCPANDESDMGTGGCRKMQKDENSYVSYIDKAEFDRTQINLDAAEENINAMRRNNKECVLCGSDDTIGVDEDGNYLCDLHS